MAKTRNIKVEAISRVEGEGGLHVTLSDGQIEDIKLSIYEPPRFFEAFLRGRPLEEVPDITARICGICPVAYQMSSVHAIEQALAVKITPEIRQLRRLLYCGEWIESHVLHMHLLQAPDFFSADSGIDLAAEFPDEINRGLRMKKYGNELLEVLGGRAIHPINVRVGGFHRAPRREELQKLIPAMEWGLQAAIETTRWVATFNYPDFSRDYEMVALVHPDEFPMNEGQIHSSSGLRIDVEEYEQHFQERQVPHSTALHSVKLDAPAGRDCYHVGPLARIALNFDRLSETARRAADEVRFDPFTGNPFQAIIARGLEVIQAFDEALQILRQYRPCRPYIDYDYRDGEGCSATEAPRGLLYHRYQVDSQGMVKFAKIVPPTSQNQMQIEADLRHWLPKVLVDDDRQTAVGCERLIRSYDPCISCSTHFLKLTIERDSKERQG